MAKEKERKIAHIMYVDQKKTAVEIAPMVGVSEKTISAWVNKYGWKIERDARSLSNGKRIANLEQIISKLAEDRIDLDRQLKVAEKNGNQELVAEIRSNISKLDDSVSKWNKTLQCINKDARVPLVTYLEVMQTIFEALQQYDTKLFMQTIDFQEQHINDASLKLSM